MKKTLGVLSLSLLFSSLMAFSLTSCGAKTQFDTPTNITFDYKTGKFTFDAVENAKTYTVGLSEVINDVTGEALLGIQNSSKLTFEDGSTKWVWATQIASATGVADTDGDGKVEGALVYRSFSSTAADAGTVVDYTKIPVGDYVLTIMADADSEAGLSGSEYAYYQFSKEGALSDPTGFTGKITDNKLVVTSASNYYINSLSTNGLADKMELVIKADGTTIETISVDNFVYTNEVIGPAKSYKFTNLDTMTSKTLDATKKITATIQAVSTSASKTSSKACDVTIETTTPEVTYGENGKLDLSGKGTAGDATITISVGTDASGNNLYGLEVKENSVVVARESGTFTVPSGSEVTTLDEKKTYAVDTVLTFTTTASDLATKIMDGKTLKVEKKETENRGQTTINYAITGEGFSYNGTSFAFTDANASSGGGGWWGPGPM